MKKRNRFDMRESEIFVQKIKVIIHTLAVCGNKKIITVLCEEYQIPESVVLFEMEQFQTRFANYRMG